VEEFAGYGFDGYLGEEVTGGVVEERRSLKMSNLEF
jgi:hypothetical protein